MLIGELREQRRQRLSHNRKRSGQLRKIKKEYNRGVAQLVARDVWEQDTGGDAPAGKRALRAKKQNLESP